jgi:hypothetical protein
LPVIYPTARTAPYVGAQIAFDRLLFNCLTLLYRLAFIPS